MIKKVTEIFNAWKVASNPSEDQRQIAEERLSTCMTCEFKKDQPILHCEACGCPLQKKIFSQVPRSCPKNKWDR
jgi:hypothetical protein